MWFYQKLQYLGFVISADGKCDEEIEQCVGAAAKAVGRGDEEGAGKTRANEEGKAESVQCHDGAHPHLWMWDVNYAEKAWEQDTGI